MMLSPLLKVDITWYLVDDDDGDDKDNVNDNEDDSIAELWLDTGTTTGTGRRYIDEAL